MLFPVYAVFPFYFDWIERGQRGLKTMMSCGILIGILVMLYSVVPHIYKHLSLVIPSMVWICVGNYIGKAIRENSETKPVLLYVCIGITLVKVIPGADNSLLLSNITYASMGIVGAFVFAWLLERINCKPINNVLGYLGDESLELYLTNIYLLQAFSYFEIERKLSALGVNSNRLLEYTLVFIFGLLASDMTRRLSGRIWYCCKI